MSSTTLEKTPVEDLDKPEKLQRFKSWFRLALESYADQRRREKEDLEFQVGENQWTDASKVERVGRPMISVNLTAQPLQLVKNQADEADLSIKLAPVSTDANKELAEVKEGLAQRIQRDGGAEQARNWAFDRAVQCGKGWYRIITRYDEDSDNPSDQEIGYERILYQDMVLCDPAAQKVDFSDARFIAIAAYVPADDYNKIYSQADYDPTDSFDAFQDADTPEWVRGEDPLVVELFYKETTYETVEVKGAGYKRKKENTIVHRAVLSGCEILEDAPWQGEDAKIRNIPIIPVVGRELQPVDGKRRWEGMVRPARGAQQMFNYFISSVIEDVARLSKAPYVGAEGQFEGHEEEWGQINRINQPYVQYRPVGLDGKPIPPPKPMQIDGTKMGLSLQGAQWAEGLVQKSTAVYEPSLGNFQRGEKGQSGKAIIALQQQADAGTGNYLGNLARVSMLYEAKVLMELIPIIYDRPGRVTQVLGGENEPKQVMLNAPYVMNGDSPVPPPPPPPTMPGMPPPPAPKGQKEHKLSEGKYSVAVSIGKSAQTKLQQGADEIGQILASDPSLMPIIGDIYFQYRDFPGHVQIAERLSKLREKTNPGLGDNKDGQPNPEQLQAQMEALKAQLQDAQQKVAQAADLLKTEQAKQQATIEKAKIDAQQRIQIQQIKDATALAVAKINAAAKGAVQAGELQNENLALAYEISHDEEKAKFEAAHETALQNMDQAHEMEMAKFQAAHEVAMAAAGGNSVKATRDTGQSSDSETPGKDAGEKGEE